jgi:hypothetical protein
MNKLNIVTAISRLEYLSDVEKSFAYLRDLFDVKWYQMYDAVAIKEIPKRDEDWIIQELVSPGRDYGGAPQRNRAFDLIENGFVYILDDDNKIHPSLGKLLLENIEKHPQAKNFIFSQLHSDGKVRMKASPWHMKFGSIDWAQIVFSRECIADFRMLPKCYWSDYYIICDVYKNDGTTFIFIDELVTYWNGLRKN